MVHTYAYAALKVSRMRAAMSMHARLTYHAEIINLNANATYNYLHPLSFAVKNGDNEVYYLHEAMRQDDYEDFIRAMVKEIEDHSKNGHWKRVLRHTIGDAKTVKAVWTFKRKRRPDGSLLKHKVRLCVHGGM